MDSLTTAVPANRAQRRAIQREQKKAAKKAAKKAIKLGLPVPVGTEIPVQPAAITTTINTPTNTILKEVEEEDDQNAIHLHQGSPLNRSSLPLDQLEFIPVIIPTISNVSTMHDDTIETTSDSSSVIMDIPHTITTMSTHEEEIHDTDSENEQDDETNDNTTKEIEEEIISDTTSATVKPSSFLSSPSYSSDDIKYPRIEHHAISPDDGHHCTKNSDHINFLENQSSAETLVLKTKAKKFHKVILTSLKKKKATKKEKEPKPSKDSPLMMPGNKKSWKFWKKDNDKMTMT